MAVRRIVLLWRLHTNRELLSRHSSRADQRICFVGAINAKYWRKYLLSNWGIMFYWNFYRIQIIRLLKLAFLHGISWTHKIRTLLLSASRQCRISLPAWRHLSGERNLWRLLTNYLNFLLLIVFSQRYFLTHLKICTSCSSFVSKWMW